MKARRWFALLLGVVLLAGCGGGGRHAPASVVPAPGAPAGTTGSVTFSIVIPAKTAAGKGRARNTVDPTTNSLTFSLNGTPQVLTVAPPACSASPPISCTFHLDAPVGAASIVVATYASANGTGTPLNVARTQTQIGASGTTALALTLSDFVVTNTNDSGPGSLRYAVTNISPSHNIVDFLLPGTGPWTIALTCGVITDAVGVWLSGPGSSQVTIDAGGLSGILNGSGANGMSVSGLTLQNGSAVSGGAISNPGALNVSNVVFKNNVATSGSGGAIQVSPSSPALTIQSSTFSNNSAPSGVGLGGAVSSQASATTISGSTFSANVAGTYSAGACSTAGTQGQGGAVYVTSTTVTIAASSFTSNVACGSTTGNGGAVAAGGSLTITDTTFRTNSALSPGGTGGNGNATGGAVFTSGAALTLAGTVFDGNIASAGPGTGFGGVAFGGAIAEPFPGGGALTANAGTATVTCNGVSGANVFCNNTADGGAAGGMTGATSRGGAIYGFTSMTAPVSMAFSTNAARASGTGSAISGGAIANVGTLTLPGGTSFVSNSVTAGGTGATAYGGAIDANAITLTGSVPSAIFTFAQNSATNGGGAIHVNGSGAAIIGASFVQNSVTNATLSNDGGGALLGENYASYNLLQTTFDRNSVSGTSNGGGAIALVFNTIFKMVDSTMSGNTANGALQSGGSIFIATGGSANAQIFLSTIAGGTSGSSGGNISSNSSQLEMLGSIVAYGTSGAAVPDDISFVPGSFVDDGYNVVKTTPTGLTLSVPLGDHIADPLLGSLSGPAPRVFALPAGSPAVDLTGFTAACTAVIAYDERGSLRPNGAACDAGAYER